jgi:hypothetical protein
VTIPRRRVCPVALNRTTLVLHTTWTTRLDSTPRPSKFHLILTHAILHSMWRYRITRLIDQPRSNPSRISPFFCNLTVRKANLIGLSVKTPMYHNSVGNLPPFFLGPRIVHHASNPKSGGSKWFKSLKSGILSCPLDCALYSNPTGYRSGLSSVIEALQCLDPLQYPPAITAEGPIPTPRVMVAITVTPDLAGGNTPMLP